MSAKRVISSIISVSLAFGLAGSVLADPVNYGEELKNMSSSSPTVSFTDLGQDHWAYKYVAEMVTKNVIKGYPDGKFRPDNIVSRDEFATIIVRAAGLQPQKVTYSSFADVKPSDWSSPFIETAKDYLTGYRAANGQYMYNPSAPALREDITIAIVKLKGYDVSRLPDQSTIRAMFKDYDGISEKAKSYVALAVENKLVSGFPDDTFRPQAPITRAEAAVLLWRAFMYGNDNKDVGGGTPVTPTQPSNPSTPAPSTGTPGQSPATSYPPVQKFTVETLVGGIGKGYLDGPVSRAKINRADSMVVDRNDNIFFLDSGKVRKFNSGNGTVETYKEIDDSFTFDYISNGKAVTRYDSTSFNPQKLAYNPLNNKVYLAGIRESKEEMYTFLSTIHEVSPSTQAVGFHFDQLSDSGTEQIDFITFGGSDILYGLTSYEWAFKAHPRSQIVRARPDAEAEVVASSKDGSGIAFRHDDENVKQDVIMVNGVIYTFDTHKNTLSRINLFPRKVETVVSFQNMSFTSIASYNDRFYLSDGATIYVLDTNGKLNVFVKEADLTYTDGNPVNEIQQLGFDSKGNIILYDDQNKAIRRINL